ncbi:MAG: alpha/beta hydrolase domain-containing protein, partial [Candidatus Rariloculaceae bacterium]
DGANSVGVPGGVFDRAIAYGSSQSGRLLRSFLYDGFNGDTKQRKVFDGVLAHIGGAARGSFNQRFAQPSRAPGGAYEYPNRIFPFSDEAQTDPATGTQDGLLAHIAPGTMPKIFYTNSSTEYWRSIGAMTHVSIDGKADLELLDNVRTYHFAGTQHTPASFPSRTSAGDRQPNPNDYSWLLRSLLVEMDRWVVGDETPPENRYSTLAAGTLVPYEDFAFPAIPGVDTLAEVSTARALNFGSKLAADGIITQEPPTLGITYPFLVPQVDRDGNEIDGLRLPEIEVPLATHTGWSSPNPVSGVGVYAPFPRTAAERVAESDPRLSIEERYTDRAAYIGQVAEAAIKLIDGGYLLGEDLPSILEIAGRRWDHQMSDGAN